jgi:hypothetical protein
MLDPIQSKALDVFITPAEMKAGYKYVVGKLRDGKAVAVKVVVPADDVRKRVFESWIGTRDDRANLLAVLESGQANGEFLDSLEPSSLQWLASTALAILIGPEKLREAAEQGAQTGKLPPGPTNFN